jgi:hypothetical protein
MSKKTSQVPDKGAPFHVPHQGFYGERCSVYRASGLLIHLYLSGVPKKDPSHEMR